MKLLQDSVKVMARDLVRTRQYVKKFIMMRANIQAVSLKVQTLKSQNSMAQVKTSYKLIYTIGVRN